jgi:hypothetical protein
MPQGGGLTHAISEIKNESKMKNENEYQIN